MKINLSYCCFTAALLFGLASCLPSEKVLDMSKAPLLSKSEGTPRTMNLSFFVPAFSMLSLASQMFPNMFPSFTTTTTSRRRRDSPNPIPSQPTPANSEHSWIENFIANGLLY